MKTSSSKPVHPSSSVCSDSLTEELKEDFLVLSSALQTEIIVLDNNGFYHKFKPSLDGSNEVK